MENFATGAFPPVASKVLSRTNSDAMCETITGGAEMKPPMPIRRRVTRSGRDFLEKGDTCYWAATNMVEESPVQKKKGQSTYIQKNNLTHWEGGVFQGAEDKPIKRPMSKCTESSLPFYLNDDNKPKMSLRHRAALLEKYEDTQFKLQHDNPEPVMTAGDARVPEAKESDVECSQNDSFVQSEISPSKTDQPNENLHSEITGSKSETSKAHEQGEIRKFLSETRQQTKSAKGNNNEAGTKPAVQEVTRGSIGVENHEDRGAKKNINKAAFLNIPHRRIYGKIARDVAVLNDEGSITTLLWGNIGENDPPGLFEQRP